MTLDGHSGFRVGDLCCVDIGPYNYVARVLGGWWRARLAVHVPGKGVSIRRVPWPVLQPYDGRNDD